jgi:glutathione peroxidase
MKKTLLIITMILSMFPFKNKVEAQYEKLFFDLSIKDIDGQTINLSKYNNKAVLLVNVASKCGFTKQYTNLQKLWDSYKGKGLIVLGIPSNQFGGQEPGTNEEIKKFCTVNFNITFPMTDKVEVKGDKAHEIYKWAKKNYGKSTIPKWNFHKILINKEGKIQNTFSSFTEPTSKKITKEIEKILN